METISNNAYENDSDVNKNTNAAALWIIIDSHFFL